MPQGTKPKRSTNSTWSSENRDCTVLQVPPNCPACLPDLDVDQTGIANPDRRQSSWKNLRCGPASHGMSFATSPFDRMARKPAWPTAGFTLRRTSWINFSCMVARRTDVYTRNCLYFLSLIVLPAAVCVNAQESGCTMATTVSSARKFCIRTVSRTVAPVSAGDDRL
jgi:hypothetical protein